MKIVLLGHEDLASLYAQQRVIAAAPQHEYSVFLSGNLPVAPETPDALTKLAALDARLCADYRAKYRLSRALLDAGTLPSPNSDAGQDLLENLEPDLIVSIRYRRILDREIIAVPRLGVINLHSGVLPDYKGVMATFWAMLHGETMIGATLHRIIDRGIDTGPVVGIRRIRADYTKSYLANVLRLYGPGCGMLVEALRDLEAGKPLDSARQRHGGRYFSTPEAAHMQAFQAKGLELANGGELAEIDEGRAQEARDG